jgi:ABC-type antimicrobial peptide transport system permease subunit
MGIRMALGATGREALRTLAVPGIALAAAGIVLGLAGAVAATGLLRGFVWGVQPADPLTFAVTAAVLLTVATLASIVPALRILQVDPARTLRQD